MDIARENQAVSTNSDKEISVHHKERLNLALFSAGKAVSLLGTYIYSFAISLYILRVTGSGMSFALSILISTLPRVLLSPIAGSVADRVDKKRMIVGLDFASGAVVLLLFLLSSTYGLRLIFIYSANLLLSIISTFFNTSFTSAIPRLVTDKSLVKVNSYNKAIDSGSQILGPVIGGFIFGMVSINLFLLFNGISFVLSAVSEVFIDFDLNRTKQHGKAPGQISVGAVLQDIREVFGFIRSHKLLSTIIPFSISCNFLISACLSIVLPFVINNVIGLSSSQYGIIQGSFSIGMLIAAIAVGKLPEKEKKLKGLVLGIAGMGITITAMGIPALEAFRGVNPFFIFAAYAAVSFLFALFLVLIDMPLIVAVQRSIPQNMMGRVWGVMGTISSGLVPLGVILAGITLDRIPVYVVFFITGIYFIAAAFLMYKNKAMQEY